GEGRGIDGRRQVPGDVALLLVGKRAVLQRGDTRQRQRLELAVRILADIGGQLFRLLGALHRAPVFEVDVGAARRGSTRGRRGTAGGRSGGRRRRSGGRLGRVEIDAADQIGVTPGQL